MSLLLTCPECSSKLKIADNLAGKKIKCPKCATVFQGDGPAEAAITTKTPHTREPEGITSSLSSDEDLLDEEDAVRPRRAARDVRTNPSEDAVSTIIPYKNGRALAAYYCGVFSFIPCAGNLLGPAALVLGILGLRYVKAHPSAKGTGHAIAGIIMGALTTLLYWGLIAVAIVMGIWGR